MGVPPPLPLRSVAPAVLTVATQPPPPSVRELPLLQACHGHDQVLVAAQREELGDSFYTQGNQGTERGSDLSGVTQGETADTGSLRSVSQPQLFPPPQALP